MLCSYTAMDRVMLQQSVMSNAMTRGRVKAITGCSRPGAKRYFFSLEESSESSRPRTGRCCRTKYNMAHFAILRRVLTQVSTAQGYKN